MKTLKFEEFLNEKYTKPEEYVVTILTKERLEKHKDKKGSELENCAGYHIEAKNIEKAKELKKKYEDLGKYKGEKIDYVIVSPKSAEYGMGKKCESLDINESLKRDIRQEMINYFTNTLFTAKTKKEAPEDIVKHFDKYFSYKKSDFESLTDAQLLKLWNDWSEIEEKEAVLEKKDNWVAEVEPKEGKMHSLLNIPEDEKITDHFTDPEKLAKKLINATKNDFSKVIKMLGYAAFANKHNPTLFRKAQKVAVDMKKESEE